jgi:hypothetical protein
MLEFDWGRLEIKEWHVLRQAEKSDSARRTSVAQSILRSELVENRTQIFLQKIRTRHLTGR